MSGILSMSFAAVQQAMAADDAGQRVFDVCVGGLTEIAEGRSDLASIRHPLGFVCLPVWRDGDDGVCVHVWSNLLGSVQVTTSPVHSHSWDLTSFVLYGQVDNRVIQVDEDAAGTHRMFEIHSSGEVDEVTATSSLVRWAQRQGRIAGAGELYQLDAGIFHTTVVDVDEGAATVVLGRTKPAPDRSLGRIEDRTHRVPRQRCRPEETTRAARIILDRIAASVVAR